MMIVGITGGIGSGKSKVMAFFEQKGAPCFFADRAGHEVLDHDHHVVDAIKKLFGAALYDDNNVLNRKKLSAIVFDDPKKLDALNKIVHPAVAKAFDTFCKAHLDASIIFKEAAILFETGGDRFCDKTLLIIAPEKLRIARVKNRDQRSEESIKARMENQWPDEKKIPLADFVIVNENWEQTLPQLEAVYQSLLAEVL